MVPIQQPKVALQHPSWGGVSFAHPARQRRSDVPKPGNEVHGYTFQRVRTTDYESRFRIVISVADCRYYERGLV